MKVGHSQHHLLSAVTGGAGLRGRPEGQAVPTRGVGAGTARTAGGPEGQQGGTRPTRQGGDRTAPACGPLCLAAPQPLGCALSLVTPAVTPLVALFGHAPPHVPGTSALPVLRMRSRSTRGSARVHPAWGSVSSPFRFPLPTPLISL